MDLSNRLPVELRNPAMPPGGVTRFTRNQIV